MNMSDFDNRNEYTQLLTKAYEKLNKRVVKPEPIIPILESTIHPLSLYLTKSLIEPESNSYYSFIIENNTVYDKETHIVGITNLATIINRHVSSTIDFIKLILNTTGIFEKDILMIKGEFSTDIINLAISKYINLYVKCNSCGSNNTYLYNNYEKECTICFNNKSVTLMIMR